MWRSCGVRAMAVDVGCNRFAVLVAHNFGLTTAEQMRVVGAIRSRMNEAEAGPARMSSAVLGDWNFLSPGEGCWDPRRPGALPAAPSGVRDGQRLFAPVLADLVDLRPSGTTHSGATQCESPLDRACSSSPPWVVLQMRVEVSMLLRADAVQACGVSGHAPLVCTFVDGIAVCKRSSPVPLCIPGCGEYEVAAKALLGVVERGREEVDAVTR